MRLPVLAVAHDIDIIKNRGLGAAGCAVHKVVDLPVSALIEEGGALESGNHVQRRISSETPAQLRRRELQLAGSLLLFFRRVDKDNREEAKDGGEDDKRKEKNPHSN